ncbi:MAG: LemA family protein [Armatimonadota bacterium]
MIITLAVIIGIVAVWIIATYNRFIRLSHLLKEAWSGVDVQLKRRHDLIPNQVETVKGYSGHERETLPEVTALRAQGLHSSDPHARAEAETTLTHPLKSLFAVAEAYSELKANEHYLSLQHTLVEIEEQSQYARRYYNGSVRNFNILAQSFPSNLLAGPFGFRPQEYFEIELSTEREAPEVRDRF